MWFVHTVLFVAFLNRYSHFQLTVYIIIFMICIWHKYESYFYLLAAKLVIFFSYITPQYYDRLHSISVKLTCVRIVHVTREEKVIITLIFYALFWCASFDMNVETKRQFAGLKLWNFWTKKKCIHNFLHFYFASNWHTINNSHSVECAMPIAEFFFTCTI